MFASNTATILFGLLMERHQRPGSADWSAFWFGSLVGIVPWALIVACLLQSPVVPGFGYAIGIVQFVLFFSFALNMAPQYARIGWWRDYLHGEVGHLLLSLIAKSLLAGWCSPTCCELDQIFFDRRCIQAATSDRRSR